ncbi:MAG: alpha/beta hydrolase [Parvibaculaceae bacterium]
MTMDEMRRRFDNFFGPRVPPKTQKIMIGDIPAAWFGLDFPEQPIVLYFHGGGFQMGSIRSHAGLIDALSDAARARVLAFDYRLAPEHIFPAQIEDSLTVYRWLLASGIPAEKVVFAGDSAGAGLALVTFFRAREAGLSLPCGMVFLSPWLDMVPARKSYETRARLDPLTQREKVKFMAKLYLGAGGDPTHPLVSPINGDLSGLPPILIHIGDHETIMDDALEFVKRVEAEGGQVQLRIWDQMIHHFQLFPELDETQKSLEGVGRFIRERLSVMRSV